MASNSVGTPQSSLYHLRQGARPDNRDRSAEQNSTNSGNPMMPMFNTAPNAQYSQFYGGQDPNLGRYTPPTINNPSNMSGAPQWNNNPGGYAYNLPNAYGGYQGLGNSWLQNYLGQGGPQMMPAPQPENLIRNNQQQPPQQPAPEMSNPVGAVAPQFNPNIRAGGYIFDPRTRG